MSPSKRRHLASGLAIVSGLLLAACYPSWSVGALVWIALAPLLVALWFVDPSPTPRRGFALGYLFGAAFFLTNVRWLVSLDEGWFIAWPALSLFCALYFGVFGAFAASAGRLRDSSLAPLTKDTAGSALGKLFSASVGSMKCAFLNAAAWVALEWLRGMLLSGFGWNGLGVALVDSPALIQIADIVGVAGTSFVVVFCTCVAIATVRRFQIELHSGRFRPHLDFAVAVLLVILIFVYGVGKIAEPAPEDSVTLRTIAIQPNIPQTEKWNPELAPSYYQKFREATEINVTNFDFDIVIWPETCLYAEFNDDYNTKFLNHVLGLGDFTLVAGVNEDVLGEGAFNSLAVMRGDVESAALHRKIHLVPFGEYVPFRDTIPPLEAIAGDYIPTNFERGTSTEPLPAIVGDAQIIPLICFEDTVGRLARKFVRDAPQLMINITNDGWFHESACSHQHVANAIFRCIELRRPMIRCANTGVTCIIDATGSLYDRSGGGAFERKVQDTETGSTFVEGWIPGTVTLPNHPPMTFYARFGDVFAQAMLAIVVFAIWLHLRRGKLPATNDHA